MTVQIDPKAHLDQKPRTCYKSANGTDYNAFKPDLYSDTFFTNL